MTEEAPEHYFFHSRFSYPTSLSVSTPHGRTDYSFTAHDCVLAIKYDFYVNQILTSHTGRELLTGWARSAGQKATVFVSSPLTAQDAYTAVRQLAHELNASTRIYLDMEEYMRPVITGIPIRFRIIGKPEMVECRRRNNVGYVPDVLDAILSLYQKKRKMFTEHFTIAP